MCLCATGKTVFGVQRQDVNGEWGTVLRDVGSFYISGGSGLRTSPRRGHLFTSLWGPFKNFETGCVAPSLVVFIGQSQTPV